MDAARAGCEGAAIAGPAGAVADVAEVMVQVAVGVPPNGVREPAGRGPQDLVDVARGTLARRGASLRLIPGWHGLLGVEMAARSCSQARCAARADRLANMVILAWLRPPRYLVPMPRRCGWEFDPGR